MRYQGGKSKIATAIAMKIRDLHPAATDIWEPFVGGGGMTGALLRAGFKVHASDAHEDLILMWHAAQSGDDVFGSTTETEYGVLRTSTPSARRGFVGYSMSFGGAWFGGFARDSTGKRDFTAEAARNNTKILASGVVEFKLADYTATPDEALAYCDIPYKGTKPYKDALPFDHDAFWAWVRNRQGATFVSELQGPEDMQIVWRKDLISSNSRNSPTSKATASHAPREERLYYKPTCL